MVFDMPTEMNTILPPASGLPSASSGRICSTSWSAAARCRGEARCCRHHTDRRPHLCTYRCPGRSMEPGRSSPAAAGVGRGRRSSPGLSWAAPLSYVVLRGAGADPGQAAGDRDRGGDERNRSSCHAAILLFMRQRGSVRRLTAGGQVPGAGQWVLVQEIEQQAGDLLAAESLGCVPSGQLTSSLSQTRLSLLRGFTPSVQRYGPQSTTGAITVPLAGSKLRSGSPLAWAWITQRTAKAPS